MRKMVAILVLLSVSSSAFADICGIVTQSQAENTLSFLKKGAKLTQTYSNQPNLVVEEVTLEKSTTMDGVDYYDLKVNGQSIDPGHTNIVINKNVSLNLGRLVGCDAEVSDPNLIIPTSMDKFLISK